MEFITLNTGEKMPLQGFGVFQIPDAAQCEQVIYDAIKTGYRLLDTAAAYMNEEAVGKGVKRAVADGLVTREELFITTKVWVQDAKSEETAYEAVKASLGRKPLTAAIHHYEKIGLRITESVENHTWSTDGTTLDEIKMEMDIPTV